MGLWAGIVFRNNEFGTKGTIDVLLYQNYNFNGTGRDFSREICEQTEDIKYAVIGRGVGNGDALTKQCYVLSGFGNGINSGAFSLPQVGARGLVATVDNPNFQNKFVWLGGFYGDKVAGRDLVLPSDDTTDEELENNVDAYISNKEGDNLSNSEYVNSGTYIVKTKTNKIDDYNNIESDKINFKNILPENTFIMSKEKAALRHNINDYDNNLKKGIEQVYFDSSKVNIKRKVKNNDKLLEQDLTLNDESITLSLSNEDGSAKTTVKLSNDGNVEITTTGDLKVSSDKNMNFGIKGDVEIKADGKMILDSGKGMNIKAAGIDLGQQVDNLAQTVATLTTQGSPASHAATPNTAAKGSQVATSIQSGYEV